MKRKGYIALFLAAVLLLGLCACSNEPTNPYEGMVQVETGYGSPMWIRPLPQQRRISTPYASTTAR